MRPTMADVAERAGVSASTVSLVLNDKPGISPEVRISVMRAVEDLGYRVRERRAPVKSSLAEQKNKTVSIVHYASPEEGYGFEVSGLFIDFAASMQDYFQGENINWVLVPNYQDGDERNLGFRLLQGGTILSDGLILIGIQSKESQLLQNAISQDIPVVVFSRNWPDLPISTVSQDHTQQANLAIDHLLQLGHRRIGFLAKDVDRHYDWFKIRLAAYENALASQGITVNADLISVEKNASEAAQALLSRCPDITAIFATHDENAVQSMLTLKEMGFDVPRDISIIGMDNSQKPPEGYPGLTTVTFPHAKAGQLGAKLILDHLADDTPFYSKVFLQCHLIKRESCTAPRE